MKRKLYIASFSKPIIFAAGLFLLEGAKAATEVPLHARVVINAPDVNTVDDFNDGNDRNYWNGSQGVMMLGITRTYDNAIFYGASGRSLKLAYNVTTNNWNGFFMKLGLNTTKNISSYRALQFRVRGGVGGVEHLKISLRNSNSTEERQTASLYVNDYLDGGITSAWRLVTIPLDAFANLRPRTNVTELDFIFEGLPGLAWV